MLYLSKPEMTLLGSDRSIKRVFSFVVGWGILYLLEGLE